MNPTDTAKLTVFKNLLTRMASTAEAKLSPFWDRIEINGIDNAVKDAERPENQAAAIAFMDAFVSENADTLEAWAHPVGG